MTPRKTLESIGRELRWPCQQWSAAWTISYAIYLLLMCSTVSCISNCSRFARGGCLLVFVSPPDNGCGRPDRSSIHPGEQALSEDKAWSSLYFRLLGGILECLSTLHSATSDTRQRPVSVDGSGEYVLPGLEPAGRRWLTALQTGANKLDARTSTAV